MPRRLAAGLLALALAAPAGAQTPAAAIRHGYAWPTDRSPAAAALPRANPPVESGWNRDLDLPPIDAYQGEALRYVRTGLRPTLVVQLAVVAIGQPVQAMIVRAPDKEHLRTATRAFGQLPWQAFLELKASALAAMTRPPPEPAPAGPPSPGPEQIVVDAVDQLCTLEYAGLDLTVRRRLVCSDAGPLQDASQALIDAAERAAGPPEADAQR
jgi:hypothetical protein